MSAYRERQEGNRETRGWRRVRIPHSRLETRSGFRDRAGYAGGEFRPRGRRHHHVGERQKRHGRHTLGGRKARALRHRRPGAGSGEDLQRAGAAYHAHGSEGGRRRGAALLGILVEEVHVVQHGEVGSQMVRSSSWQLSVLLQDWLGELYLATIIRFIKKERIWVCLSFSLLPKKKIFFFSFYYIKREFFKCIYVYFLYLKIKKIKRNYNVTWKIWNKNSGLFVRFELFEIHILIATHRIRNRWGRWCSSSTTWSRRPNWECTVSR